jgi:hypothetical protein
MVNHTCSFGHIFEAGCRLVGLMGMGFQSISEYNAPPVFQTLVKTGKTTEPVFAFKLSDSGAELTIGGTNNALYTGGFTAVPVTQEGYVSSYRRSSHYSPYVWQVLAGRHGRGLRRHQEGSWHHLRHHRQVSL